MMAILTAEPQPMAMVMIEEDSVPSMGWSMGGKMPFGMMIGGGCIHHH
jgi:hypothetical protein